MPTPYLRMVSVKYPLLRSEHRAYILLPVSLIAKFTSCTSCKFQWTSCCVLCSSHQVFSLCAGFERHQSNHVGGPEAWQMQTQPLDFLPGQMGGIDGLSRQRAGPSFAHNSAPASGPRVSLGGGFQIMGQVSQRWMGSSILGASAVSS